MSGKFTVDQIRKRFDADVERFSNRQTGQSSFVDAPLMLELVTQAAAAVVPDARDVLDIGCGAGNYTLALLERMPGLNVTLIDLSQPMLDRAAERLAQADAGRVTLMQTDIREADLGRRRFDVVVAGAVLHHLRSEDEWRAVMRRIHTALRPGGALWIIDMVRHEHAAVQRLMFNQRYGDYLSAMKDKSYRDHVFDYIDAEDSPVSIAFQLDRLREAGFIHADVLHVNTCFAALGGFRAIGDGPAPPAR